MRVGWARDKLEVILSEWVLISDGLIFITTPIGRLLWRWWAPVLRPLLLAASGARCGFGVGVGVGVRVVFVGINCD